MGSNSEQEDFFLSPPAFYSLTSHRRRPGDKNRPVAEAQGSVESTAKGREGTKTWQQESTGCDGNRDDAKLIHSHSSRSQQVTKGGGRRNVHL